MSLSIGDRLPDATFRTMTAEGVKELTTADVFGGKKVVLLGVPGAFTPSCHENHLPSYVRDHDTLKAGGADTIACLAVNDAFVLDAWSQQSGATDKVLMLADGNAEFTRAVGMELDATGFGLGVRSRRFSAIVDDRVVKELHVEKNAGEVTVTAADRLANEDNDGMTE